MEPARKNRRGSALVLALIVVTVVATLSMALLQLNGAVTKRQQHNIDDMRAFYLAEAGLSEAYLGLGAGKNGQIGSEDRPALAGDGMVWVDAIPLDDGSLRLRSTGLCQAGRSTLEIVVRREEQPLGIFADESIDFATPFLLDGYDSDTSLYHAQALPAVTPNPGDYVHDNVSVSVVRIAEMYYDYAYKEGDTFYYVASVPRNPIARTVDARDYFEKKKAELAASGEVDLGPTTGVGGMLGSNGPISLSAGGETVEVYGDVVPGSGETVDLGWGVTVTGNTEAREEPLELPPVTAPDVDMLPGFTHGSAIPRVVPPSDVGYESITVEPGSELVVQGEGNLVVGDLELRPDGFMHVENEAGAVNLYVTGSAQMAEGSEVFVDSLEPANLSLQAADTAGTLSLKATSQFHGLVYAPDSHVAVGAEFEIFGGLVANTLELDPETRLHFDSGVLGDSGAVPLPRLVSWRTEQIPTRVAQSRVDPFKLYQLDESEFDSIADAQETTSWFFDVDYYGLDGKPASYSGPYEYWDASVVSSYAGYAKFTPPTAELEGEWTIWVRYRDLYGATKEFSGTVADYVASVQLTKIYDKVLTPPPGL